MISELLSAIHRVDAGVNWIRVAAFLQIVTGSWRVFLFFYRKHASSVPCAVQQHTTVTGGFTDDRRKDAQPHWKPLREQL